MSGRKKPGARVNKKPYTKPEVTQIPLRPEEAVLGGCKVAGTNGPNRGGGSTCVIPSNCSAPMS